MRGSQDRLRAGDGLFGDELDLFEFRSLNSEKFRHLDDLIRAYKVRRLGAESIYTGSKLAALHGLRDV